MNTNQKTQRGASAVILIIILAILGAGVYIGLQYLPQYIEAGTVDSILLNCPELSAVQILFGGHEVETLTGHLDLSKPLVLNRRFIASS